MFFDIGDRVTITNGSGPRLPGTVVRASYAPALGIERPIQLTVWTDDGSRRVVSALDARPFTEAEAAEDDLIGPEDPAEIPFNA